MLLVMIVCHCRGITDATIRGLARDGVSSSSQLGMACSAGVSCGGCRPLLKALLAAERTPHQQRNAPPELASTGRSR